MKSTGVCVKRKLVEAEELLHQNLEQLEGKLNLVEQALRKLKRSKAKLEQRLLAIGLEKKDADKMQKEFLADLGRKNDVAEPDRVLSLVKNFLFP